MIVIAINNSIRVIPWRITDGAAICGDFPRSSPLRGSSWIESSTQLPLAVLSTNSASK